MSEHVVFKSGNDGGTDSFLCPPGHPNLKYSVWVYQSKRHRNEMAIMAVTGAAECEWLPQSARNQAQRLLDKAELKCSELYVRHAYGYFRTMYVPESGSRDVSGLISDPSNSLPAERHAAVAMIREYFPDHAPRVDLIADCSYCYGTYECAKCGQSVQYEARFDALAKFDQGPECPSGGGHEWPQNES